MNKGLSIALMIVGTILIVYGINASNSFGSDVSRFFTGSPTDRTVWLMIGGVAAVSIGFFGLFRVSKE